MALCKKVTSDSLRKECIWPALLPKVREILVQKVPAIETAPQHPLGLRILETADVTGDGVPEALVDLGILGPENHIALMAIQDDSAVIAKVLDANGNGVSAYEFKKDRKHLEYGFDVKLLPEKSGFYTGEYTAEEIELSEAQLITPGPVPYRTLKSCAAIAYAWQRTRFAFAYNSALSSSVQSEYCKELDQEFARGH